MLNSGCRVQSICNVLILSAQNYFLVFVTTQGSTISQTCIHTVLYSVEKKLTFMSSLESPVSPADYPEKNQAGRRWTCKRLEPGGFFQLGNGANRWHVWPQCSQCCWRVLKYTFFSLLKQSVHSSCAIMVLYIVHTWKWVSSGFMLMAEFLLAVWLSIGFAKVKYIFNLPISDIIILSLNNMYFLVI